MPGGRPGGDPGRRRDGLFSTGYDTILREIEPGGGSPPRCRRPSAGRGTTRAGPRLRTPAREPGRVPRGRRGRQEGRDVRGQAGGLRRGRRGPSVAVVIPGDRVRRRVRRYDRRRRQGLGVRGGPGVPAVAPFPGETGSFTPPKGRRGGLRQIRSRQRSRAGATGAMTEDNREEGGAGSDRPVVTQEGRGRPARRSWSDSRLYVPLNLEPNRR